MSRPEVGCARRPTYAYNPCLSVQMSLLNCLCAAIPARERMADVTWTEQHDWGPGKYLTMVPPERVRIAD